VSRALCSSSDSGAIAIAVVAVVDGVLVRLLDA
jgi:hypothetical protein